jgi:peptidoglycan/LPS O-acetylase OafA/YrhL
MGKSQPGGDLVRRIMGKTPVATSFFVPGYIPQLDGLRGTAVILVLIGHAASFVEGLPYAGMVEYVRFTVDVFFVLSGFLITGILLDSKGSAHYFRNFYARRSLRVWPLYYLVLFLVFVVAPLFRPAMRPTVASIWPAFIFYVQNIRYHYMYPFGLGATWSLAIEEQFYLTWPVLVFLLKRQTLSIVAVCLVVVSTSVRLTSYFHGAPPTFPHMFTLARLDSIAFGCLAALWLRSPTCTLARWRVRSYQFLGFGLGSTALARILMHRNSSIVSYTFLAMAFTGLLGISLISDPRSSLLGRTLSLGWLRHIGKISYGLYLWHLPLFILWFRFLGSLRFLQPYPVARNLLAFVGQLLLAALAASISWRFFEEPILRHKNLFPSGSEMHCPTADQSEQGRCAECSPNLGPA